MNLKQCIESSDPLEDSIIKELISHREEDLFIDYKETFDNSEKHWLALTTDCLAFANTYGGYIVFGVKDVNFQVVGIAIDVQNIIKDTNLLHQKINRYILPPLTSLRSKTYANSKETIAVIHIPESKGKTHIISKAANLIFPSGAQKQILFPGTIYFRRSATNNIIDPEDLDFLINKRIDFYKEKLMERITKVVEIPFDKDILIFDSKKNISDSQHYAISDDANAIPIKGISFSIVPTTLNEEIISWTALFKRDLSFCPSETRLWLVYLNREDILKNEESISTIIQFSIHYEIPFFYWLQFINRNQIMFLLNKMIKCIKSFHKRVKILHYSGFLGRNYYMQQLKLMREDISRLNTASKLYQIKTPFEWFYAELMDKKMKTHNDLSEADFRSHQKKQLDFLAEKFSMDGSNQKDIIDAIAMDCFLYAKTNKYID